MAKKKTEAEKAAAKAAKAVHAAGTTEKPHKVAEKTEEIYQKLRLV